MTDYIINHVIPTLEAIGYFAAVIVLSVIVIRNT